MRLIGHRGASHVAPENTLASIRASLERSDGFELDLQLLVDEIVLLHDAKLDRTAALDPPANMSLTEYHEILAMKAVDLTWDQVRRIDVGSWKGTQWRGETVPTFAQALELLKEYPRGHCFAELKTDTSYLVWDYLRQMVPSLPAVRSDYDPRLPELSEAAVLASGVPPSQLTWISFDGNLLLEMKRRMPEHQALLVALAGSPERAWEVAREVVNLGLDGIDLEADADIVTPRASAVLAGAWEACGGVGLRGSRRERQPRRLVRDGRRWSTNSHLQLAAGRMGVAPLGALGCRVA